MIWKVLAAAALLVVLLRPPLTADVQPVPPGRFALVTAEYVAFEMNGSERQERGVFLVDSQTGRVWRYADSAPRQLSNGEMSFTPSMMIRVPVEEIDAGDPATWTKQSMQFKVKPTR